MDEIKKLILKFFVIELVLMFIANTVLILTSIDNTVSFFEGVFSVGFLILHTPIVLQYLLMRISLIGFNQC